MAQRSADEAILLVNGMPYEGYTSLTAEQSFDKAVGTGTLKVTPTPGRPFPIRKGDHVVLLFARTPVITGYVMELSGSHGWEEHDFDIQIRDQTQDLVDSTCGPNVEMKPPISLKDAAQKTIGKMGLPLKVIDKVNPEPFGPAEVPVGAVDQTGFSFLDDLAQKRQTVLNTDGKGNLCIDRNQGRMGPGMLHKGFEDDPLNNVKRARYKNSDHGRHGQTNVAAQKSPNDRKHWESKGKDFPPGQASPLSKKWGIANDTSVRGERKMHVRSGKGLDGGSPKKAAKWLSNVARSRGFQYTATVQGFEMAPGQIWWPGFVIPVFDAHFEISDVLLIVNVKFHKDLQGGATTEVTCTYGDGFSESDEQAPSRTASRGIGGREAGSFTPSGTEGLI